jgi:MFS family permease
MTFGYAAPVAALAASLPLALVCVGAVAAGVGSSIGGALSAATTQRLVPLEALGRISAWGTVGAFGLGPVGLAAAGPVATAVGVGRLLAFSAAWQLATVALMLLVPSIRTIRDEPDAQPLSSGSCASASTTTPEGAAMRGTVR